MPQTKNPFEGLKRKRLPGMHMITACEGGAPLDNSLAAFFFMQMHDETEHDCLIKALLGKKDQLTDQIVQEAKSPTAALISHMFGMVGQVNLILEEWSYLDERYTNTFLAMAYAAIEQVQRWIAYGSHAPHEFQQGAIVVRPPHIAHLLGDPQNIQRSKSREYVLSLLTQLDPALG